MKRAAPAPLAPQKPTSGTASRPDQLVRTDRHTQKLQKFFLPSSQTLPGNSPCTEPQPEAELRHDSPAGARPLDSCSAQQGAHSAEVAALEQVVERKRPRMDSTDDAALAAAREKVQIEAHSGGPIKACSGRARAHVESLRNKWEQTAARTPPEVC